jgi:hypothetical protein
MPLGLTFEQIITIYLVKEKKREQGLDNACMPIADNASLSKL